MIASIRPPIVRPALKSDAERISEILIRSIRELCAEDHQGDADLISHWTGNKSVEDVLKWIDGPHELLVSISPDGVPAAVGMHTDKNGEILLLYVDPDYRGAGHSDALLAHMENALKSAGHKQAQLDSTRVAFEFYRARGWRLACNSADPVDSPCLPMRKALAG